MPENILLAGVGGQGIVTAGDLVAQAALIAGRQVKKAEVHGMAQRGGSVVSHVRISGDGPVYSPMIPDGHADFLIALELLEGLRWTWMLRPAGRVIADDRRVAPSSVSMGSAEYPARPEEPLAERGLVLPATQLAGQAGVPRAANVLVLGALSVHLDLPAGAWDEALAGVIKTRHLETNRGLFRAGRDLALERLNRATDG